MGGKKNKKHQPKESPQQCNQQPGTATQSPTTSRTAPTLSDSDFPQIGGGGANRQNQPLQSFDSRQQERHQEKHSTSDERAVKAQEAKSHAETRSPFPNQTQEGNLSRPKTENKPIGEATSSMSAMSLESGSQKKEVIKFQWNR